MKKKSIQDIKRTTPPRHKPVDYIKHEPKIKEELEDIVDINEADSIEEDTSQIEETPVKTKRKRRKEKKMFSHDFTIGRHGRRGSRHKTLFVILGILALFTGIYFISLRFGHATVYITHKNEPFTFTNKVFKATRTTGEDLAFEVMAVSDSVEKDFVFSDSKQLSTKAKGTVVLYNEYGKTPQKLLINTRLVDDKGRIYMTDKALTVPGYTVSNGKIVPGSLTTTMTASEAGDKYNSEPKDFTLVGFKGTAKEKKIYARSKGSITGGASGLMYMPTAEEKGELNTDILLALKSKLSKSIEAQVPPDYILFQDSIKFSLDFDSDNALSDSPNAKINASGTATAIILNQRELEENIIRTVNSTITTEEINQISIPELSNFVFKISDSVGAIDKSTSSISFELTGEGTLAWNPDYDKLKSLLAGVSKIDVNTIFITQPGIESARVLFTPPWQKTLPTNLNYIKVKQE